MANKLQTRTVNLPLPARIHAPHWLIPTRFPSHIESVKWRSRCYRAPAAESSGYYGQDTFHLSKNSVLNGDPGVVNSIITKKLRGVSPRVGFAVGPTRQGKQSIRGSYTLVFDQPSIIITSGSMFQSEQAPPFGGSQNFAPNNATYKHSLDNPLQGIKGGNIFPTSFPPKTNATFPSAGISPQEDPYGTRRAYVNEYNLGYQDQISGKWLLSVSYIETHTVHLSEFLPINYAAYCPGLSTGVAGSWGTLTPVPAAGTACSTTSNTTQRYKLY